jgi:alpha-D-ribose 1-methylphosphonate 5-triphosphate synthase subunit PhnG
MKTHKRSPWRTAIEDALFARDRLEMAAVDRLLTPLEASRQMKAPRVRRRRRSIAMPSRV